MNNNIYNTLLKFGYLKQKINPDMDILSEINRLRKEKNATILAHYYQTPEIQDLSDYIGDSLALAQRAEKVNSDIIIMAGVHFMAETIKILCPEKKVLIPDLNAGCSLADSCPAEKFSEFLSRNDHDVVIQTDICKRCQFFAGPNHSSRI